MTKATATIQGHDFDFGEHPYAEGHTVTANEANALNQVRIENIRNNTASKIKAAAERQGVQPVDVNLDLPISDEADAPSLRQSILDYASGYVFGARAVRTAEPVDPIEREALKIARDTVRRALAANKPPIKVKDLPEGKFDELVEAFAGKPETIKEATRRLKTAESLGADAVDLSGLAPAEEPAA